jgi:hypothetical protein
MATSAFGVPVRIEMNVRDLGAPVFLASQQATMVYNAEP